MEKPKNDFNNNPYLQSKCPVCGGTEFEWGRASGTYVAGPRRVLSMRGIRVFRARRCIQCNNVLSFVDEELSRRQNELALALTIFMVLFLCIGVIVLVLFGLLRI